MTRRPLPGEPELTHIEAIWLNTRRKGSPGENIGAAIVLVMCAASRHI